MKDDQDRSAEKVVLKGIIKTIVLKKEHIEENTDINENVNIGLSSKIIASMSLGIKKYTLSGSRIDKVLVNERGEKGLDINNFKHDDGVNTSIKTVSFANI